jgi:glucose-6-phosphate 1-dehydrogenase
VPFYIRIGKTLPVTCTEVVARLRRPPPLFPGRPASNSLRFRISPDIEVALGLVMDLEEKGDGATVELLASRRPGSNEFDAYERVLTDAITGDQTLFAREDYIEGSVANCRSRVAGRYGRCQQSSARPLREVCSEISPSRDCAEERSRPSR